jgi:hypothetical protein
MYISGIPCNNLTNVILVQNIYLILGFQEATQIQEKQVEEELQKVKEFRYIKLMREQKVLISLLLYNTNR